MGRSNTRFQNPNDFKKQYGYDYTDDPEFDSRSDAGGGKGAPPQKPETVQPEGVWGGTHFTGIKPPQDAPQEVHDQWADAINQPFGPGGEVILRSSLITGKHGAKSVNPSNPASQSGALRRVIRPVKKF